MRELPKDVLKMASGLILPSGLAGHRRQLCNVSLWLNAWAFYTNVRGCIQFNAEKHPVCVSNSAQTIEHC